MQLRNAIKSKRLRFGISVLGAFALASLAACGNGGGNGASGNATDSFSASFNTSFDKSVHDSCVTSAQSHGTVSADLAEKYCSCLVTQFEPLTVQQKLALKPTSPEMQAAETTCLKQSGLTPPS